MSFISLAAPDLAIDLGTTNTLVYKKGKGLILNEATRVAMDINNGQIVALGDNTKGMEGKTPANIVIFSALEDGVIADYEITRTLLKYFLEKSVSGLSLLSSRVVISVPSGITDVEGRAVEDALIQAGARDVLLLEEPLASIAGVREDAFEPTGNMVINIGGGTTEIALTSLGRIVTSKSIKVGGESINRDIIASVEEDQQILLGLRTAEEVKLDLGSANPSKEPQTMELRGRDLATGLPTSLLLDSTTIGDIIQQAAGKIADGAREVLERTPPELANNVVDSGILLTGGSSQIDGMLEYLQAYIGLRLVRDPDPMTSTVLGASKFIDIFTDVKKARTKEHR